MEIKLFLVHVELEGLSNGCSSSSRLLNIGNSLGFSVFESKNLGDDEYKERNDECTPESSNNASQLSTDCMWIDISIPNCSGSDDNKPNG